MRTNVFPSVMFSRYRRPTSVPSTCIAALVREVSEQVAAEEVVVAAALHACVGRVPDSVADERIANAPTNARLVRAAEARILREEYPMTVLFPGVRAV